jgi:glycosyltransferase involved in cell wall biosynthesis
MAAGLAIVSTTSGAVPEVLEGSGAQLVAPGDWPGLARALAEGPLSRPPGTRVSYPPQLITRYSTAAAAARLADAYRGLLA